MIVEGEKDLAGAVAKYKKALLNKRTVLKEVKDRLEAEQCTTCKPLETLSCSCLYMCSSACFCCMLLCPKPRDDLSTCEKTLGAVGCKFMQNGVSYLCLMCVCIRVTLHWQPHIVHVLYFFPTQVSSTTSTRRSVIWNWWRRDLVISEELKACAIASYKPCVCNTSLTKATDKFRCGDKANS